jgi:hypothetical protein
MTRDLALAAGSFSGEIPKFGKEMLEEVGKM